MDIFKCFNLWLNLELLLFWERGVLVYLTCRLGGRATSRAMAVSVKFEDSLIKFTEHVARAQRWRDEEVEWDYRDLLCFLEKQCEWLLEQWRGLREDRRAQHWAVLSVQRYDFERVRVWLGENKIECPACKEILGVIEELGKAGAKFEVGRGATEVFRALEGPGVKAVVRSLATIKAMASRYKGYRLKGKRLSRTQWKQFVDAVEAVYGLKARVGEGGSKSARKFLDVLLVSLRACMWKVEDYRVFAPVSATVSEDIIRKCGFIKE